MTERELTVAWTRHIRRIVQEAGAEPTRISYPWTQYRFRNICFDLEALWEKMGNIRPKFGVCDHSRLIYVYFTGTTQPHRSYFGSDIMLSVVGLNLQQYHRALLGIPMSAPEIQTWGLREKALFARCLDFPPLKSDE
jgi:hypothetical protein